MRYEDLDRTGTRQKVVRALREDPRVSAEPIQVEAQADKVILHGVVQSARRKLAAGEAAAAVANRPIENRLRVEVAECVSDETLTHRVYEAFRRHPAQQTDTVAIRVRAQRVDLFGVVASEAVGRSLENLALAVTGVRSVESRLQVDVARAMRDEQLVQEAQDALGRHGLHADVVVADGAAYVRALNEQLHGARVLEVLNRLGFSAAFLVPARVTA